MAERIPSLEELIEKATDLYRETFNEEPTVIAQAPGRVNLIGEHTDYNDGFVLPMALPLCTVVVGKPLCGFEASIISGAEGIGNGKKPHRFAMKASPSGPKWTYYVKGVIANYRGGPLPGFNAAFYSSVPIGGGLSSSASLEVSTYNFLDAISKEHIKVTKEEKALACQRAEHEFAGVPCGIMDQFVSWLGEEGNALLIDCKDLTSSLVPLDDPDVLFLVTNSNVKHSLNGSEYPTRRRQCKEAADLLGKNSLRECNLDDVKRLSSLGADEEHIKRARHVISEIIRTKQAAELFSLKKFEEIGKLMVESHNSLRDDFDVSTPELDQLVELAMEVDGVFGSRMTGGGFGGCTVTMVKASAVQEVIENISAKYEKKATFFICKPSKGASIVKGYK